MKVFVNLDFIAYANGKTILAKAQFENMHIKYIAVFIFLFLTGSLIANDSFSKYLIFQPQEIQIHDDISALKPAETKELSAFLAEKTYELTAGKWTLNGNDNTIVIEFIFDANLLKHDEYHLEISESGIRIVAKNPSALKYGKQTLSHLLNYVETENVALPQMLIQDWANFEKRGYMLDISRDKVPRMISLYALVDQLSEWRINELQLYTEHTFAYSNHKVVWENASPMTADEVQRLDKYCSERGIDLVPNQNSFGHMENWLKHDEYLDLCECETNCNTIWGKRKRTALAPTNPNSLKLMQELYAELLPNFTSKYANIGGDETVELGLGKSKALSDKIGKGQVYLDFLIKLNDEVNKHGKLTQFWGDIVLNHPELIKDIPKNMTALVWGYDATYPFDKNLVEFHKAELDFYVCPGTSSWRSEIGRNHNAFINLQKAAVKGEKYGAKGYLITDWGDYGHFQPKSVSYPSLVLGASYAWNVTKKTLDNLEFLLNEYVFEDKSGYTAKAILTLGNAYVKAEIPEGNANAFHLMIRRYAWTMQGQYQTRHLNKNGLLAAESEIEKGLDYLRKAEPRSYDADIIVRELEQAAALAKFGIHLGLARLEAPGKEAKGISAGKKEELISELTRIIKGHREVWIVRNRPGGLNDSAGKLEDVLNYLKK